MKKKLLATKFWKKKRFWIGLVLVVLILAVAGFFVRAKIMKNKIASAVTVNESEVTKGDISNTIEGSGKLTYADEVDVTVPVGVEVDEIKVESGDSVKKGDTLATLDKTSVSKALVDVQDQIDSIDDQLDDDDDLSSLEIEVLKEERADLKDAETDLKALRISPAIKATSSGIVGDICVTEKAEVTKTTTDSDSSSSSSSSSSSASPMSYSAKSDAGASDSTIMSLACTTSTKAEATASIKESLAQKAASNIVKTSDAVAEGEEDAVTDSDDDSSSDSSSSDSSSSDSSSSDSGSSDTSTAIIVGTVDVTAPETGKKPQTEIDNDCYTGEISWDCSGPVFSASTKYTATIVLTAKDGYTFSESYPPKVANAAYKWKISDNGNTMTITAEYEATKAQQANKSGGSVSAGGSGGSASGGSSSASGGSIDDYGAYVAVAFTIAEDDKVAVEISVDELDILSVEKGQTATITLDAIDGESFTGKITKVASVASSSSSSSSKYAVDIEIDRDEDMRIGMNASASINVESVSDVLIIPMTALQQQGDKTFVYTENKNGELSGEVTVETGLSDGSNVEIKSGLEEGQTVYYTRSASSDSEDSFEGMPGGGGMPGSGEGGGMPSGGGNGGGERPSGGGNGGGGMPGGN